jgi:hypothetical protein
MGISASGKAMSASFPGFLHWEWREGQLQYLNKPSLTGVIESG